MAFFPGIRLPEEIERGAVGGPQFNTTVLTLASGFEKRNQEWSQPRFAWDIGYGLLRKFQADPLSTTLDVDQIIHIFYSVGGRANSFRFKDWSDFQIGRELSTDIPAQTIGLGDDTTTVFQVFKTYTQGGFSFNRTVTKLVSGTVDILLDGVVQASGFTLDVDRGTVTFSTAPASTGGTGPSGEVVIALRCEFDVHVRFDTDDLQINMQTFNAGSLPSIPLVGLRGTGLS